MNAKTKSITKEQSMKRNANHPALHLSGVNKSYRKKNTVIPVLKSVSFEIMPGESCSIVGPSGSGKSTLLNICAGIASADSGSIMVGGVDITVLNEDEKAGIRAVKTGFIFQNFRLVSTLNAWENILLPAVFKSYYTKDYNKNTVESRALSLLDKVGLLNRKSHYPDELSGGEEQRISVARAFINDPSILFADEPTGNLDKNNGKKVLDLMFTLNKENHSTLLIVTHDMTIASMTDKMIRMEDGEAWTEKPRKIKKIKK